MGGLGKRNFLDSHSDLDIAIFYRPKTSSNHFLPFQFHATINETKYEFNIHQLFFENEINLDWNEGKKEAYGRAIILVDKDKRIADLIATKIVYDGKSTYNRLIWIMGQYVWRGQIHSLRTLDRGFPNGAHDLLNECVELLIEAIYIINRRYRPHKKWRIAMLTTMNLLPDNFFENLREAMLILDFSHADINRRIKILDVIYQGIGELIRKTFPNFPAKPYEYYCRNFFQLKKDVFIQKTMDNLNKKITTEQRQELEGKMCLNLVSSHAKAAKYLK